MSEVSDDSSELGTIPTKEAVGNLDEIKDASLPNEEIFTEPLAFSVDIRRGYLLSQPDVDAVTSTAALCRNYKGNVTFHHDGKSYDAELPGTMLDSKFMKAREFQCTIMYDPFENSSYNAAKTLKMRIENAFMGNPHTPFYKRVRHLL